MQIKIKTKKGQTRPASGYGEYMARSPHRRRGPENELGSERERERKNNKEEMWTGKGK